MKKVFLILFTLNFLILAQQKAKRIEDYRNELLSNKEIR